ncbi:methylated-DNA--[protein]-cysteine S-methyltransferase [Vampirovibrio sp.]|uniref:methylated-DNA--[protein]-cysteine S-methyltransferase n=1 Tax=Vampirovibrio sp. TaxID=2717857 RepID=UPI00359426D9
MTNTLVLSSPVGWWRLYSSETHLQQVEWLNLPPEPTEKQCPESKLEQRLSCMISRYFKGDVVHFAPIPVCLTGSPFQNQVLEALRQVPYGETRSYQWLATACGNPKASRAMGGALGRNPLPLIIPCHRIITSAGGLGGFMRGNDTGALRLKGDLLGVEGISLKNEKPRPIVFRNKGCP